MGPSKSTELRVGAFVVVTLVLFGLVIFVIGSHKRYFQRQYTLLSSFSNVKGLIVGAPVRLAGVTAGRVSAIYFRHDLKDKSVVVEMKINQKFKERICENSVASIQTMGLLGDKYVEIALGSMEYSILEDCDYVDSVDPIDFLDYVAKTETVIDGLNTVLLDLQEIGTQIKAGEGLLHAILYDPAGGRLLQTLSDASVSLDNLVQELTRTSKSLSSMVGEEGRTLLKNLAGTSTSLDDMIREISSASKSVKKILTKIETGAGMLGALVNDPTVYNDLKVIAHSMSSILTKVETGEGTLGAIINDPAIHDNLKTVSNSLNSILRKVETGEGTLGAIINDPTVYEDLKVILGGAKRSETIKRVIRYTIKKKREAEKFEAAEQ